MKTKILSLTGLLFLVATTSFAQIPAGSFSGFVSNNPFNEWCQLNHADIQFQDQGNGQYQVNWTESGLAPQAGFCENRYDASFTPSGRVNEWNVSFYDDFNLVFGKAVLNGNELVITADYNSANTAYLRFNTRLDFSQDQKQVSYQRRIETWSGPSLFANGNLFQ